MPVLTRPDGVRLYHELHGNEQAPPLILLEGMGGDIPGWRRNIPVLARELRVIAYDFRGNGNSDEPSGPVTMATFVDDTLALLDPSASIGRTSTASPSAGWWPRSWRSRSPERVRTLILGCTHAGPRHVVRGKRSKVPKGEPWRSMYAPGFPDRHPEHVAEDLRIGAAQPAHPEGGRRQWEAMQGFDSFDRLPSLRVPTLDPARHGGPGDRRREREAPRRADPRRRAGAARRRRATCTTPSRPRRRTPPSSTSSGGTPMPEAPRGRRPARGGARRRAGLEGLRGRGRAPRPDRRTRGGRWSTSRAGTDSSPRMRRRSRPRGGARREIDSVLGDAPDRDASVLWVCEGWHEDIERAIAAFRANEGGRSVQYVVADVTDRDPSAWGEGVEVLWLEEGTGWAAARNAGIKRTRGRTVLIADGSVEPTGDVFGPLERGAGGRERRRVRAVRDRDPRPPGVRGGSRGRRRCDRGLPHGAPAGDAPRGRVLRREVPVVPHGRHRVLVPGEGSRSPGDRRRRARHEARASDVVRDAAGGSREMVEEELLSVPRPVP